MAHQAAAHGPCALPHPTWPVASPNPASKQGAVSGSSSPVPRSAGGRTFPGRLRRLAWLDSASQSGRRPPAALERPCSHADPRRLRPLDTPGASAAALLLAPRNCCQNSSGCMQGDFAEQNHRHPTTAPVGGSPTSPKTPLRDRWHQGGIRPRGRRRARRTLDRTLSRLARVDSALDIDHRPTTGLERPKWSPAQVFRAISREDLDFVKSL